MDSFTNPKNLIRYCFQPILILCYVLMLPTVLHTSTLDHNHLLIYSRCENQTALSTSTSGQRTDSISSILSKLFRELEEHSSESRFFQTNAGSDKMAVSGLFQCRGDLTNDDCHSCVKNLPEVSTTLCGEILPARVQLAGCRMHYQAEGAETNRLQLLNKACSYEQGSYGFQAKRDAAFAAVQECISGGGSHGYYCDQICESVRVKAQCDGNLEECDCGECVSTAVQIAEEECGYSVAAEIYLDGCFLSYGYQNNGIYGSYDEDKGLFGRSSNKVIAIVIGGIAAVLFGAGLCYCCRTWGRSKDGNCK